MPPLRRRSSLLPFIGISLLLLLLPSAWSHKVRLAALVGLKPLHSSAFAATALPGRLLPSHENAELQTQNDFYKDQIQKLLNEKAICQAKLDQVSGLKQACPELNFRILHAGILLPTDGSTWRKSLTLSLGANAGIQKGMLVLYNSQLVGRILQTSPWTSLVQLVTDPAFKAGAVAVPKSTVQGLSFDKRRVGLYEGTSGPKGQLKWIMGDSLLEQDGFVMTTEDPPNGVPRGLILGRVSAVATGSGPYPRVEVDPIVDFRSLEHVMVLIEARP